MPRRRFATKEEAEDAYDELKEENIQLKTSAEKSIGGFLNRNEKWIIALITAITLALGGNIAGTIYNHSKVTSVEEVASTNREAVKEVGERVDQVDKAVKQKKGPFGE